MQDTKVSWVILTYNRYEKVQRAITHCMRNAGMPWHEIIWVDNGSTDGVRSFMSSLNPAVSILHNKNLGVSHGYNRGMALATGDYICITGCDMLMPDNWLKRWTEYCTQIPNTGMACIYGGPLSWVPERARQPKSIPAERFIVREQGRKDAEWFKSRVNGLEIIHGMPMGRKMFRRELLKDFGYLREDFGLYGYEDLYWGQRVERVCEEKGLLYYVLPNMTAQHLGTEGVKRFDGQDEREYHAFKQREAADPAKQKIMEYGRENNWPYYNPYY